MDQENGLYIYACIYMSVIMITKFKISVTKWLIVKMSNWHGESIGDNCIDVSLLKKLKNNFKVFKSKKRWFFTHEMDNCSSSDK